MAELSTRQNLWRRGRKIFRLCRITVLLLLLALVVAGLYLNRVGLPDFLKRPLLDELRARGVDLRFSKLRVSWHRGFVAQNVQFGPSDQTNGPNLSAGSVELHPDFAALKKFDLSVGRLVIHRGFFAWPLPAANGSSKALAIEAIETDLRLLPDDSWRLDRFDARVAGAKMQVYATLAHASAVRDWPMFKPEQPAPPGQLEEKLGRVVEAYERIRFASPPDLKLDVQGDARDLQSFTGLLTVSAPGATTPWGALTNAVLTARLSAAAIAHALPVAKLSLRAGAASTRWAKTRNLQLIAHSVPAEGETNLVNAILELQAGRTTTDQVEANGVNFVAHWQHSLTNPVPLSGDGDLQLSRVRTEWGVARSARLRAMLEPAAATNAARADGGWAAWTKLEPYALDAQIEITGAESRGVQLREIGGDVRWRAPDLNVTNFHARLSQGGFDLDAELDVASRETGFHCAADFDPLKIAPLLPEAARSWMSQFKFAQPPKLQGRGRVTLPAWTNREPDWSAEVLPTLRLAGELQSDAGSYRGVEVSSADARLFYSNLCWYLPELRITRPEGRASLAHISDNRTRDIYWRIYSDIDPGALKPLLDADAQEALDLFASARPPHVEGEVWANGAENGLRGFAGRVAASNFTFRGVSFTSLQTAVQFTNQVIEFPNPRVLRGGERVTVDRVWVDLAKQQVILTNGFSNTDPMAIFNAIGPKTAQSLEPYQFLQPPEGRVNGVIPLHGNAGADLMAELNGGPFHWWRVTLPRVNSTVHWTGDRVAIRVDQGAFYDGSIKGMANFDWSVDSGTDFQFELNFEEANLHPFLRDVSIRTNHVEGTLSGQLIVDRANTADWESWQGRGAVKLRNGLVWEIPVFGIFSPMLNGLSPGLGSTRFSDGSMTYAISNSVIHFDNLELDAPLLRMDFRGTVDFHEQVNARVTAELLRNTWLIGPVISAALWPIAKIFEYKVTGTLTEPKAEPMHVPKILMLPLQPMQLFKGLFPDSSSRTNTPPAPAPEPAR